jgi:hypothetical protein
MDRASSLIFPGSKTLAGWWRQLQPYQPKALWIGYAFLHRVEASVHVVRTQAIDPLVHLMLRAVNLEQAGAANPTAPVRVTALEARLRLPTAVVQRVLLDMQGAGLLIRSADAWLISERGRQALEHGRYPDHVKERRIFPFLERLDPAGQRTGPALFLPIAECAGVNWPVDDAHRFDITWLKSCIEQPGDWKDSAGFPRDIEALASDAGSDDWQHVVVDRPERALLALVLTAAKERLGFAVKVDGWTLHDNAAALRLSEETGCPELAPEPAAAVWQDAWRDWCRQKQFPTSEVAGCTLAYQAPRLDVQAPPRLVQRLQAAKSDLFKGDAWLLVGDGYVRAATQLAMRAKP